MTAEMWPRSRSCPFVQPSVWCLCPSPSCPHWSWDQWPGGDAGCHVERLLLRTVPLPPAAAAGPRALVVHQDVQVSEIFLLQKLRFHTGPRLVLILQRLLCAGRKVCSCGITTSTCSCHCGRARAYPGKCQEREVATIDFCRRMG